MNDGGIGNNISQKKLDELCNKLQIDNIPDVGLKYFLIK
jgi:hypothetical protein